jgi:hypothetical protein
MRTNLLLLLLLLLSTDFAFIGIHLVYSSTNWLSDPMYSLYRDRGYAELFQYVKLYWLVLLFGLLAAVRRQLIHLVWMVVFAAILIDDCFSLHEAHGFRLASAVGLEPMLGLRARDIGEFLILTAAGATLLASLTAAYLRADAAERRLSRRVASLGMGLVFVGGVLDAVHAMVRGTRAAVPVGVAEDGGELVIVSLMLSVVFRHAQPPATSRAVVEPQSISPAA